MGCNILIAVRITNRTDSAVKVQKVLTDEGCKINMRIGLHDQEPGNICSDAGILILQLCCPTEEARRIESLLNEIDGVKAQFLDLD